MAVLVEFVTLGDASKHLGIPAPTLRLWTDELEKHKVHYVKRNHRDERVYYENDLEIFAHMRDLKKEHGRKTQTKDIALMIYQEAEERDMFDLRREEDAPKPEPVTNTALELLNNEDIKQLLASDRVKQLMDVISVEASKKITETIRTEYDQKFVDVNKQLVESHEKLESYLKERDKKLDERMAERDRLTNEFIQEMRAKRQKPWWKKLLGE